MSYELTRAFEAFAPTVARVDRSVLQPSFVEFISAVVLPSSASADQQWAFAAMFGLLGSSGVSTPAAWKEYVVSYTLALFPALRALPSIAETFNLREVNADQLVLLTNARVAFRAVVSDSTGRQYARALIAAAQSIFPALEIPATLRQHNADPIKHLEDSGTLRVIYSHYSLVVYLAGKQIDTANRDSIEKARPRALISKYRLNSRGSVDGQTPLVSVLNDVAKMSVEAHSGISRAWLELTTFRIEALSEVIRSAVGGQQIAHEVMYTTISMLEFAQMTHAVFCKELLSAEPWVASYGPLAACVQTFISSSSQLLELDAAIRPYVKVIFADRAKLFPRRDLLPLIECAIADKRVTGSTMMRYFSDSSYAPVVAAFQAERSRRRAAAERVPRPVARQRGRQRDAESEDSSFTPPPDRRRARPPPAPPAFPSRDPSVAGGANEPAADAEAPTSTVPPLPLPAAPRPPRPDPRPLVPPAASRSPSPQLSIT